MRGLRLGQKLLLSYLLMAVLICTTGVVSIYLAERVGDSGRYVASDLLPQSNALLEAQIEATSGEERLEELVGGTGTKNIQEVYQDFQDASDWADMLLVGGQRDGWTYRPTTDPKLREQVTRIKALTTDLHNAAEARYQLFKLGGTQAGSEADKRFDKALNDLVHVIDTCQELMNTDVTNGVSEMRDANNQARTMMIVAMLIGILVALGAGILLARSITLPVVSVAELSRHIASGDLTTRDDSRSAASRADEIGALYNSFITMRDNIRDAIRGIQAASGELATNASEVGATAKQYSASTAEQATAVAEVSATVEEIRQTSKAAADSAQQVVHGADSAVENSQRGLEAVGEAIGMTKLIGERVEGIAQKILQLSEQNTQIGEIVETVNDLAEQSNLLAVNASIEAAKAGEHGRGFSVVASEVRSLAEQSRRATQQIRGILADIQKATESAVMATEEGTKRVEDGRRSIDSVRAVISELAAVLEESSGRARQIAAASEQQSVGISQIAQTISAIDASSKDNLSGVRQLESATIGLSEIGGRLTQLANVYRL